MIRTQGCRLAPAAALLVCLAAAMPSPARAGEGAADKVSVGYVFGSPRDLDFRLYTHLCHAFLTADAEGRIKPPAGLAGSDLTAQAHAAGVRVLVSLGGWGWDKQFAAIVSAPEAEDRYVAAVMAFVDEADYDGVDLDWEYPDTKDEVVGFERLTRRLRKQLDALAARKGRPMLVTMAASSNPGTLRWLDTAFLTEAMDWVNVMTYDYTGDWTDYAGHQSPLFASTKQPGTPRSAEATVRYLLDERRLPADRLALGIPLYGRGFPVPEPYASTKGVARTRLPNGDYRNLRSLARDKGWSRVWDDQTKTPWLIAPDHSAVFGYDDAESVALKTSWAMSLGLRGVFFWQVAGDRLPDGTNPLQEASRKAIDAAKAPAR